MKKRICVITGTRAEYGLLKPVISRIEEEDELSLQLIVTGTHLSHEFGLTYEEIEKDGFTHNEKVEILLSSDTPTGIAKSMGLVLISFSEVYQRIKPDMIIILGDRYEMFAATAAAIVCRIPVAHLHGGETTEGAFDEAFRHSITKMSTLHFTSTEQYRKRVIQLGEVPETVFNVGALGVENVKKVDLLDLKELGDQIQFSLEGEFALVTFHPVTLEEHSAENQFNEVLKALSNVKDMKIIFTKANSDTDGRIVNSLIDEYVSQNKERCIAFHSMGIKRYLSAMKFCSMVIGNSSSGIIEAPTFRIPTINIGDRQKGRIQAASIINCDPVSKDIIDSIKHARTNEFRKALKNLTNPYEGENTSKNIVDIVKNSLKNNINLKKKFYDLF